MRRERMFTSSVRGFCYLILLICSPISSVVIQLILKNNGLSLYTAMLVNSLVIAYEYIGLFGEERIHPRLWWERLIGIFSIAVMFAYSLVMLIYRISDSDTYTYGCEEYFLCALWIVPLIITLIELAMILHYEYYVQTAPTGGIAEYISNHASKV